MTVPNPGSKAALKRGCICAVLDNNHGKFPPWPPDGWWLTVGCPVHSPVAHTGDDIPAGRQVNETTHG